MKRFLIYIAIISLGTFLFTSTGQASTISSRPHTVKEVAKIVSKPPSTPQVTLTAQTQPQPVQTQPAAPVTPAPTPTPAPAPVVPTYSSDHDTLMAEAGISPSDYQYVDYIVSHESGWRYYAREPTSGAYGLCQALPGSKMAIAGSDWETNPITQLKWCSMYASGAHGGGWYNCYLFWVANRWW